MLIIGELFTLHKCHGEMIGVLRWLDTYFQMFQIRLYACLQALHMLIWSCEGLEPVSSWTAVCDAFPEKQKRKNFRMMNVKTHFKIYSVVLSNSK